jgi:hypothetical protein
VCIDTQCNSVVWIQRRIKNTTQLSLPAGGYQFLIFDYVVYINFKFNSDFALKKQASQQTKQMEKVEKVE